MSKIEWTEATWNPTTGCDRVSPGCDHCYALTLAKRLKGMGSAKYQNDGDPRTSGPGFGITAHGDVLSEPFGWRAPRRVFVNSMSDLFHDGVPDEFIARVFAVMLLSPQHTYQVLTKRHGRMRSLLRSVAFRTEVASAARATLAETPPRWKAPDWHWPLRNVWLGVSVEDQKWADIRIPALLGTPAAVRFLSCEPLLGPVDLTRYLHVQWFHYEGNREVLDEKSGIDWVIVGGESGPGARPMDVEWVRSLVKQCGDAGVSVFVKQLGAHFAASLPWSPDRKGGDPGYWPADLRVREYPEVVA